MAANSAVASIAAPLVTTTRSPGRAIVGVTNRSSGPEAMQTAPPTIGQVQPSYRAVWPVTTATPMSSHARWNASQSDVSSSSVISGGRLRSTAIHRSGRPLVAASEARMCTANHAARSHP